MRYLISLVIFLVFVVGLGTWGGNGSYFVDFPSFTIVGIFPIFFAATLFGFKDTAAAFSAAFSKDTDRKQLSKAAGFFKMYAKTLWLSGGAAVFFGVIAMLGSLGDYSLFGANCAVVLVSLLYCVLIHLAVIIPFNLLIEKKLLS